MFKPKTTITGRLENSSGQWSGFNPTTTPRVLRDLRDMSKDPESVPFVRRVLQISQTDERWSWLARHVAIVDRYAYSSLLHRFVKYYLYYLLAKQNSLHLAASVYSFERVGGLAIT